jgi:hypothetical protein
MKTVNESAVNTVLEFLDRINQHDVDKLAEYGAAGGTIAVDGKLPPENKWRASAAWLAIVENGLVKQWRVYADNKPIYDILARSKPPNR